MFYVENTRHRNKFSLFQVIVSCALEPVGDTLGYLVFLFKKGGEALRMKLDAFKA